MVFLTNELVAGLKRLHGAPSASGDATTPTKGDAGEVGRLRAEVGDLLERVGQPVRGAARAAFRRLTRGASGGGGATSPALGGYGERGNVLPCRDVSHVALPDVAGTFDVTAVPELAELLCSRSALFEAERVDVKRVGCYSDPRLKGRCPAFFELCLRLLERGLVRPVVRRGNHGVGVFTVLKKYVEKGDGTSVPSLRLVLDCRRANAGGPAPPACALGSVESLARLELPSGGTVRGYAGDVADYFYKLRLPAGFASYLWLADLPWAPFVDFARSKGRDVDGFESFDGLGFICPPMGWAYAPYLAQRCLEHVLDVGAEGRLGHRDPAVDVSLGGLGGGAHWEYLDDYGRILVGPSARETEERARAAQVRDRAWLEGAKLDVHKEQFGDCLEVLGCLFDGERRRVVPLAEKFAPLLSAVRHVVSEGRRGRHFRPSEVESLLGRMTWVTLVRREVFAVFGDVYTWLRRRRLRGTEGEAGPVPPRVLNELATWLALTPLLKAELALPWHPELSLSDAGPEGFGVVCGLVPPLVASGIAAGDVCGLVRAVDRLAVRGRWRDECPQVEREGRAALLALRRLTRDRSCRSRKVLQGSDAQSVLGALRKGRSSAPGLHACMRAAAACVLFAGLRMTRVWVPSHLNLADGPSRGARRPSVHRDCAKEHPGWPSIVELVGDRGVWRPVPRRGWSGLRRWSPRCRPRAPSPVCEEGAVLGPELEEALGKIARRADAAVAREVRRRARWRQLTR